MATIEFLKAIFGAIFFIFLAFFLGSIMYGISKELTIALGVIMVVGVTIETVRRLKKRE